MVSRGCGAKSCFLLLVFLLLAAAPPLVVAHSNFAAFHYGMPNELKSPINKSKNYPLPLTTQKKRPLAEYSSSNLGNECGFFGIYGCCMAVNGSAGGCENSENTNSCCARKRAQGK